MNSALEESLPSSQKAGRGRFQLLRNFSIISLSGFALSTGLLSFVYRQQAIQDLVTSTEEGNIALTQLFGNTLWPKYGPFLSSTQALTTEELVANPVIQQLSQDVNTQLEGLSILKVKVYDLQGRTVFSTDPSQIGNDKSDSSGFISATSGNVISQLGHRDTFKALKDTLENRSLLSSYIPIRVGGQTGTIEGVFEVYTDVTPLIMRIQKTQRDSILSNAVILSTLYGILYLFVRRADNLLKQQYQDVQKSEENYRHQSNELESALTDLKKTQSQMIHSEKMSSLGQMVAGLAHEINNPVNFIHGNLSHIDSYTQDLLNFLTAYETQYPEPNEQIQSQAEELDIDFIKQDMPKTLASMKVGTARIREIVLSLRNFSRMDESDSKAVNIHEGLESTLLLLQHRIKSTPERPEIQIVRDFDNLPLIECYAGQLNQVFMNILSNGIDALEAKTPDKQPLQPEPTLTLRTENHPNSVIIKISDNGTGIPAAIKNRIFDPFFTTKEVGKGTGMGMAISYQLITDKHHGTIDCVSEEGKGTEFIIELPKQLMSE